MDQHTKKKVKATPEVISLWGTTSGRSLMDVLFACMFY